MERSSGAVHKKIWRAIFALLYHRSLRSFPPLFLFNKTLIKLKPNLLHLTFFRFRSPSASHLYPLLRLLLMSSESELRMDKRAKTDDVVEVTVKKNIGQRVQTIESKQRRYSPRLKNIPQEKRPHYGGDGERDSDDNDKEIENINKKKSRLGNGASIEFDAGEIVLEDNSFLKWTNYESFVADDLKQQKFFMQEKEKAMDSQMVGEDNLLHTEKQCGHLPDILVGHEFFSLAEMVVIGFYGHWSHGIDYAGKFCGHMNKHNGYTTAIAVAVILSGQYEDDAGFFNEVVYISRGRHDLHANECHANLALKNNMEQSVPVRVIQGYKCAGSGQITYRYCGLYKVLNQSSAGGVSGFTVLKYRLKQLLGQLKLKIDQVHSEQTRTDVSHNLRGLVCEDISFGKEDMPIPVTNVVDNPPIAPAGFKYLKSIQVPNNLHILPSDFGCSCKGNCTDKDSCSCAQLNPGAEFPYVLEDGGRLTEPKHVVFECGPGCGCGPNCIGRVSQHRLQYRLEVYRTKRKGWAVRSWDLIPSGAPVCEYTGILRRNDDLNDISDNDYIFNIDPLHTMEGVDGREKRQGDVPAFASDLVKKLDVKAQESEFCIDAGSSGNVARFINHSCDPNLFVQCVSSNHRDLRITRVVLFAADEIPPMRELTYDYGYILDSVVGPDGEVQTAPCYCRTNLCRGRLY